MATIFQWLTIISAILLMITILLQERGTTLGGAFGGEGNVYRGRRGGERVLFIATIVIGVLFVGSAVVNLFL